MTMTPGTAAAIPPPPVGPATAPCPHPPAAANGSAPGGPRVHPAAAAAARERLAALAAGPAPGELRAAPLLEGWLVLTAPGPLPLRLAGVCTGHPRIADG